MTARSKLVPFLLLAVAAVAAAYDAEAAKYGKIMTKAVKKALGPQITPWKKDFKHLTCFSYPTDNYGVPTSYEYPRDFICDGWFCLGKEEPSEPDLDMGGFVALGKGGTILLSDTEKRELALGFIVPSVAKVIGLDLGLNWDKTVETNLTFGPAYIRRLRPDPMQEYIASLPSSKKQKVAFTNGDLILTVLDIVVDRMTITIDVDCTLNPTLDADFQDKAREWLGASEGEANEGASGVRDEQGDGTGQDSYDGENAASSGEAQVRENATPEGEDEDRKDFSVDLKMVTRGTYKIEIDNPVVICVWPKRQKTAGVLEAADSEWAGWENLEEPTTVVPVEKPAED